MKYNSNLLMKHQVVILAGPGTGDNPSFRELGILREELLAIRD
jgi:hypothetical protein